MCWERMEETEWESADVLQRLATAAYSGWDWKKAASEASASRMLRLCMMSSWQRFTTPGASKSERAAQRASCGAHRCSPAGGG